MLSSELVGPKGVVLAVKIPILIASQIGIFKIQGVYIELLGGFILNEY